MTEYSTHKMEQTMSLILEARYTDLERERALSQELLTWAEEQGDAYAKAFALTFLGDHALAACDEERAGVYLCEADSLLAGMAGGDFLRLQVSKFLGIYHSIRMDEQGAVSCYLQAISSAEKLGDKLSESVVLNNLAFILAQHHCNNEARDYYLKAYQLQGVLEINPVRPVLLLNLADIYLRLGEHKQAERYVAECAQSELDLGLSDILSSIGRCCCHAAAGEREKALGCAQRLLERRDLIDEDQLTAFDYYYNLCEKMLELGDEHYAREFLGFLETASGMGSLERLKRLEEMKTRFLLQFGTEEEQDEACRQFYKQSQRFRKQATEIALETLNSKIYLDELLQQTTRMRSEQQDLEREVQLDELTGLYTRRFMETIMREHTENADAGALDVIVLDVDYFKEYNDYYGHIQGDVILKEIASCLKDSRCEGVYPCRYGGDEFTCLCKGLSAQETQAYIRAVRAALEAKAIPHEKSPCADIVTLSIGYVVGADYVHTDGHLLFQLADQALYESKRAGRNRYTRNRAEEL